MWRYFWTSGQLELSPPLFTCDFRVPILQFLFFSFLKDPEPCGSTLFFSFNGANFSATKNTWTFASLIFSLHHAIQSVNDTWRNSEAGARPLAALHHGCNGGYHAILNAEPNFSLHGMVTNEFWKHDLVLSFYYTPINYSVHWIYPKLQKPMNSNNGCIVRFTTQLLDHAHKLRNWESKRQKIRHSLLKSGYTTAMIILSKPIPRHLWIWTWSSLWQVTKRVTLKRQVGTVSGNMGKTDRSASPPIINIDLQIKNFMIR